MKAWKLRDAREHFGEIVEFCAQEPQLVCDHNVPRAVIIDVTLFRKLTETHIRQKHPTIRQLLGELQEIQRLDPVEIDIPERQDRVNAIDEVTDELLLNPFIRQETDDPEEKQETA